MRSSRCAFSATTALHYVFVIPMECSLPRAGLLRPIHYISPKLCTPPVQQQRSYIPNSATKQNDIPRGYGIDAKVVRIVQEDRKLSPPQYTANVLRNIDPEKETLIMVAEANKNEPSSVPICKIMSLAALRKAEYERSKAKKALAGSTTVKKLELNWAIDSHDLRHRLDRVQEFLRKGWRVEILMAPKRRGRRATEDEAWRLVEKIRKTVELVKGAKEWKAMEGAILTQTTMYLEGAPQQK